MNYIPRKWSEIIIINFKAIDLHDIMEKLYFYKIELKTDYLIVFGESNDPFCKNEKSYDFLINNIKSQGLDIQIGCKSNYDLVHKYDFESIGFNQIIKNEINEKNIVLMN